MTKLSVAIIACNREKEIEACLKSVQGVDEIIVLDTGSTDKTPYIANKYKARVYYYRWDDDFSAARNRCLDYVQNSWVLSIDTDEILKTKISDVYEFINKNFSSRVVGVRVEQPDKTSFYGVRLFRKESAHWEREIHEELSRHADMVTDEIKIQHNPSKDHQFDPKRNITILRRVLEKKPKSQMDAYYLGEELYNLGQFDTALYWLEYYVEISPKTKNLTTEALYLIGECYCKLHRVKKGIEAFIGASEINPEMKIVYKRLYQITKEANWGAKAEKATNHSVLKLR